MPTVQSTGRAQRRLVAALFVLPPLVAFSLIKGSMAAHTRYGGRSASARAAVIATGVPDPLVIDVSGRDYVWTFTYPGADARSGTADDRHATTDLHVPTGTRVHLRMHSADYLYFFGVPALGLRQIAVPDLDFALDLITADAESTVPLLGDQMCGAPHDRMKGDLVVQSVPRFLKWLNAQDLAGPPVADGDANPDHPATPPATP